MFVLQLNNIWTVKYYFIRSNSLCVSFHFRVSWGRKLPNFGQRDLALLIFPVVRDYGVQLAPSSTLYIRPCRSVGRCKVRVVNWLVIIVSRLVYKTTSRVQLLWPISGQAQYVVRETFWLRRTASAFWAIDAVNLRRIRLVLGWVTVQSSSRVRTILVVTLPPRWTQLGHPSVDQRNKLRPLLRKERRVLCYQDCQHNKNNLVSYRRCVLIEPPRICNFIFWLRSVGNMLPSVKFAEDKVLSAHLPYSPWKMQK